VFLLATHGTALAVAAAIPLDWHWRVGLAVAVLASLVNAMAVQVLFLAPSALREATWKSDGAWILTLVSGEQIEARLLPSTIVTSRLVVLNFRRGRWRSRTMVLPPDTLDANLLRRLRVRLRLYGAEEEANTDAAA
jgi:hypothetical protein